MGLTVSDEGKGFLTLSITGVVAITDGAIGAWKNMTGKDLYVLRSYLVVKTHSTGAANLSCGVAATATAAASDIISALAMGGAIDGKIYNGEAIQVTAKTEVTAPAKLAAGYYINFTGSADTTGLAADLHVEFIVGP